MTLEEFIRRVDGFDSLGHSEKLRLFAWYLHVHRKLERFSRDDLRKCFDDAHVHRPSNVSQLITQLVGRDLIKDAGGLRLEKKIRDKFDETYGDRQETIVVDRLLSDLPAKLSNADQRDYLDEALTCFRSKAFRAAVVMTWNVVYDHLVEKTATENIAAINGRLSTMFGGKKKPVSTRDDFQKWKESEVIEVCYAAALISKEVNKVLEEKLDKRNSAAHPSGSKFDKLQAEAYISDLINNAMLKF